MKRKSLLCLTCCLATILAMQAQTASTAKEIANIKRDSHYLYAEATMKEAAEAVNGAKAILEATVGEWVRKQYPGEDIEVCIVKAKEHCQQLQTHRGDFFRAFVYVKKSDIMPVTDKSEVAVFHVEPTGEQPSGLMDETYNDELPAQPATPAIVLTEEERQMADIRLFGDIEPFVKNLKSRGLLAGYGKYATMPQGPSHLFVYNREGKVVATLRKGDGGQVNLGTLKPDDIKNYKNCGAIWFQLNPNNL